MPSPEDQPNTLPAEGTASRDSDLSETAADTGGIEETVSWVNPETAPQPAATDGDPSQPVRPRFGDYELINVIARGGMGVVYKARQTRLNRIVALKMILAGQFANEEEIQRFLAEAEAAAALDHPGIVPIYEVGQHQGQHFFSMGFVDGQTLSKRINESPLSARDAAEVLLRIADAVEYAHQHGIVHRDLKPGNVLLKDQDSAVDRRGSSMGSDSRAFSSSRSGGSTLNFRPMITDFGLAKRLESDSELTASGQVLGTPSYMPPEQARGILEQVGVRSDVYSLGAILYCMLTGRAPFHAASLVETIRHVCELDPVAPRQTNPEISRDLETICLKCLEKDPARRYESVGHLCQELEAFLEGRPVKSRPVGSFGKLTRWAKRKPVVASLIAAVMVSTVVGVSGIVWQWRDARQNLADAQQARRESDEARRKSDEARQISEEARREAEESFVVAHSTVNRLLTVVPNYELLKKPGMEPVRKDLQMLGRDHYLQLASTRPDDPGVRRELAQSHFFLAMTLEDLGELPQAATEYSAAAQIYDQLATANPDSGGLRRNLAACLGNLASVQITLGKRPEGIKTYRQICEMQKSILAENPDDSIAEFHLAMTFMNLALLELDEQQVEPAMKSAAQASEMAESLQTRHSDDLQVTSLVAKGRATTGRLHWERQENDEALTDYGRASDAYQELLEHQPDNPMLHAELSRVLCDIASLQYEKQDYDASSAAWTKCVEHARAAHDQASEVIAFRENYSIQLRNRALFYRNRGQFDPTIKDLAASRKLVSNRGAWEYVTAADAAVCLIIIDDSPEKLAEEEIARRDELADLAVRWLTEAVDRGFNDTKTFETDPQLASLRNRAGFVQLLERLKSTDDQKGKDGPEQ